jgi:hypothetical protein
MKSITEYLDSKISYENSTPERRDIGSTYDRRDYDDAKSKMDKRQEDFGGKKSITDPFGNKLHDNPDAAKNKYGEQNLTKHKPNVDHVVPLKKVHEMADFLGVPPEKAKEIANDKSNLWTINEHDNKSKGAKSNFEMAYNEVKDGNYSKAATWAEQGVKSTASVGGKLVGAAIENKVEQARKEIGI